jgi:hypothetical protein
MEEKSHLFPPLLSARHIELVCTGSARSTDDEGSGRVMTDKTQSEHNDSALALKADVGAEIR